MLKNLLVLCLFISLTHCSDDKKKVPPPEVAPVVTPPAKDKTKDSKKDASKKDKKKDNKDQKEKPPCCSAHAKKDGEQPADKKENQPPVVEEQKPKEQVENQNDSEKKRIAPKAVVKLKTPACCSLHSKPNTLPTLLSEMTVTAPVAQPEQEIEYHYYLQLTKLAMMETGTDIKTGHVIPYLGVYQKLPAYSSYTSERTARYAGELYKIISAPASVLEGSVCLEDSYIPRNNLATVATHPIEVPVEAIQNGVLVYGLSIYGQVDAWADSELMELSIEEVTLFEDDFNSKGEIRMRGRKLVEDGVNGDFDNTIHYEIRVFRKTAQQLVEEKEEAYNNPGKTPEKEEMYYPIYDQ